MMMISLPQLFKEAFSFINWLKNRNWSDFQSNLNVLEKKPLV